MRQTILLALIFGWAGCNDSDTDGDTDGDTDSDGYPSAFESGNYRLNTFSLEPQDQGIDFDGDGEGDNNFPAVLAPVNIFLGDEDWTRDGFNERIATSIQEHIMNVLLAPIHSDGVLDLTILAGLYDEEAKTYSIDPSSYDSGGNPVSLWVGVFQDEVVFEVRADRALIPVTIAWDEPPSMVPVERAVMRGTVDANGATGHLYGIIPAQDLIDNVIDPMIPEEGVNGQSKATILALVSSLKDNDFLMDQDLDGRPGVSAAFRFDAVPVTWDE